MTKIKEFYPSELISESQPKQKTLKLNKNSADFDINAYNKEKESIQVQPFPAFQQNFGKLFIPVPVPVPVPVPINMNMPIDNNMFQGYYNGYQMPNYYN